MAGQPVVVETKPLEILRLLLERAGQVASKAELLDLVWPDVNVVEGSLPTAIYKLRTALGDDQRDPHIITTVPRIGYRIDVPVERVDRASQNRVGNTNDGGASAPRLRLAAGILLLISAGAMAFGISRPQQVAASAAPARPTVKQVDIAIKRMDEDRLQALIDAGWDANTTMDWSGSVALTRLVEICEWDDDHDQRKMLMMARALLDAGTKLDSRNVFGDTPYSIAKAPRYCGPDHPVTVMLRRICYNGDSRNTLRDRCLASYELPSKGVAP